MDRLFTAPLKPDTISSIIPIISPVASSHISHVADVSSATRSSSKSKGISSSKPHSSITVHVSSPGQPSSVTDGAASSDPDAVNIPSVTTSSTSSFAPSHASGFPAAASSPSQAIPSVSSSQTFSSRTDGEAQSSVNFANPPITSGPNASQASEPFSHPKSTSNIAFIAAGSGIAVVLATLIVMYMLKRKYKRRQLVRGHLLNVYPFSADVERTHRHDVPNTQSSDTAPAAISTLQKYIAVSENRTQHIENITSPPGGTPPIYAGGTTTENAQAIGGQDGHGKIVAGVDEVGEELERPPVYSSLEPSFRSFDERVRIGQKPS